VTPLLADLVSWWLQAGLLLGAGLVLPPMLGLRHPGARLRLGQALLAAALLLPLLPASAPRAAAGNAGPATFSLSLLVTPDPSPAQASLETTVLFFLGAGVALRLAWLGVGFLRLHALRRDARPLAPLPPAIASAAARTGVEAEILVSREVASPVTIGWLHPAVVLPEDLGALGPAEVEAVACHELLHVKRRDAWTVLLEEGARALLWPQPAAWGVLSGIALAREQAVDRAVVESTGARRPYLRALAELARRGGGSPAAALPFHTDCHLRRRVASLAKEAPMSRTRLVLATTAAAVLLVAVGSAGAAAFPFGGDGASGPPAAPAATAGSAKPASAGDGEILKVGGDVKEPVQLTSVPPAYPEEARKNRVQGRVLLEAVVDEKGNVANVGTLESPDPALADAAVEAVKRWTYKPATLKGKPVKVRMTITVNFRLS
jgi:TonB family protein